jgi:hypothetical protein
MSHSISTLLSRNLHDVFGENEPARRRTAIDEIFTQDCVFYDPGQGIYRGRDGGFCLGPHAVIAWTGNFSWRVALWRSCYHLSSFVPMR